MNTKLALLRGINVGGKRKILMNDLKQLFADLGYEDVQTYIQSGNVIFTGDTEMDTTQEEEALSFAIQKAFGYDVPVIIRTAHEIDQLVEANPFLKEGHSIENLHLCFLGENPENQLFENLETIDAKGDLFTAHKNNLFIYCRSKYHESKLSNQTIEKKLQTKATTRNWKTILKLQGMME